MYLVTLLSSCQLKIPIQVWTVAKRKVRPKEGKEKEKKGFPRVSKQGNITMKTSIVIQNGTTGVTRERNT